MDQNTSWERVFGAATEHTRAQHFARVLRSLQVQPGDRIALLLLNGGDWLALFRAAQALGALLVPLNWRLSAGELDRILADCAPRVLIHGDGLLQTDGREALAEVSGLRRIAVDALLALPPVEPPTQPARAPADGGVILYTAAIDGIARGAVLGWDALVANGAQMARSTGLAPTDRVAVTLPLFHLMGINLMLAGLTAGAAIQLSPRFDPDALADDIAQGAVTVIGSFAPMLARLLDAAGARGCDLSGLRLCIGLEAPETIASLASMAPAAQVFTGYGQSESGGMVTIGPADQCPGSAGRAVPLHRVAIHRADSTPAEPGETGQIVVHGPALMRGYWQRPDENAQVLAGGWLRTGDLGMLDAEGNLWFRGRLPTKDLIKTGGENVYPHEVEAALRATGLITDCAVLGLRDPHWGERVVALCQGAGVDAAAVLRALDGKLAGYKRPRTLRFVDDLPRGPAGQVDRDACRRIFETGKGAA